MQLLRCTIFYCFSILWHRMFLRYCSHGKPAKKTVELSKHPPYYWKNQFLSRLRNCCDTFYIFIWYTLLHCWLWLSIFASCMLFNCSNLTWWLPACHSSSFGQWLLTYSATQSQVYKVTSPCSNSELCSLIFFEPVVVSSGHHSQGLSCSAFTAPKVGNL